MICTNTKRFFAAAISAVLLTALTFQSAAALSFPDVYFFSFNPGFGFTLQSDKGNTLRFDTNIELTPDFANSKVVYIKFFITWTKDGDTIKYYLKFLVDRNGNVYLNEFGDGVYSRMFFDQILFFPKNIQMGTSCVLGDNIKIDYVKKLGSLNVNGRSFYDVIESRLQLADLNWTLYFARSNGIIGIKCGDETYRWTR